MSAEHPPAPDVNHLLGPDGPVARALTERTRGGTPYEERGEQLRMAAVVDAALSSRRHALVEAGTGVGKSFAYLVPLLRWAEGAQATVAVATSTIALQEQLVRHDLPLLQAALPFDFSFALVKGRGNYLCTRRMELAFANRSALFDYDDLREPLEAIREWAGTTAEGSRQDLGLQPDPRVWDLVKAEQGNCMGRACRYYADCHYQRSRRRAHAARLLVLNHHVLMADLALRRSGASFLPRVDAIVIDEAHDLEDTAAEHLGVRVTSRMVGYQLGRLWSARRRKGLLAGSRHGSLRGAVGDVRRAADLFFGDLAGPGGGLGGAEPGGGQAGAWAAGLDAGRHVSDGLSPAMTELARALERAAAQHEDPELSMELAARARGMREMAAGLGALARDEMAGQVRWVEASGSGAVAFRSAPVDVGALLGEVLWDKHDCVVLTSATLCTGRPASFDYARRRLGLPDALGERIGSPFRYDRQVRLVVRTDLPDPAREAAAYERALPDAIYDAVRRTRGGAFVLFTSNRGMRQAAGALRERLEADGLAVWVQGEALERPALLEGFRRGAGVLFGVASFWQGVDVPGDALRHVIITRLPFEVPTHPLHQARARGVMEAHGDPFRDLALPAAALRLKQGFGRLIRHSSDEGIVTILDSRIVHRTYGRFLLESLPECPVELDPGIM